MFFVSYGEVLVIVTLFGGILAASYCLFCSIWSLQLCVHMDHWNHMPVALYQHLLWAPFTWDVSLSSLQFFKQRICSLVSKIIYNTYDEWFTVVHHLLFNKWNIKNCLFSSAGYPPQSWISFSSYVNFLQYLMLDFKSSSCVYGHLWHSSLLYLIMCILLTLL